jgi:arsenite-transporting ATPase
MLDRLAAMLFAERGLDPAAILHDTVTQELDVSERQARLRLTLPLARKGDISLKKVGSELVVRVDGHKRTITLPDAMARLKAAGATLEDGALEVRFEAASEPGTSEPSEAVGADDGR